MRYIVGFLITLGLIILLIILLVRGGGKPKVPTTSKTLSSYASTSAEVSLTIDGPINANSEHKQVKITVDKNNVVYEQIKGYDGNVVKHETFANTENSYNVFLHALEHAGFTRGDTSKVLADEKGYCANNNRYIFELNQDSESLERFWASDCGKPKTFLGSLSLNLSLFKAQVPGYDEISSNDSFSL